VRFGGTERRLIDRNDAKNQTFQQKNKIEGEGEIVSPAFREIYHDVERGAISTRQGGMDQQKLVSLAEEPEERNKSP